QYACSSPKAGELLLSERPVVGRRAAIGPAATMLQRGPAAQRDLGALPPLLPAASPARTALPVNAARHSHVRRTTVTADDPALAPGRAIAFRGNLSSSCNIDMRASTSSVGITQSIGIE